jgi:Na+/H+-dicarboxylate symporter
LESRATNNVITAVVLFSIALGVALMFMPDKQRLIRPLTTLGKALSRVNGFAVRLAPVTVFAIGASAAGTLTVHEFQRIKVYVVTYVVFALVMSLWVLFFS